SVLAGTKGNEFNVAQTLAAVGQQLLAGRRLDFQGMFFDPQDPLTELGARGFVEHSFTEGLTPSEMAAHHMAARQGIIDTAVTTADIGYTNHMITKMLEGVVYSSDGTVRNNGTIVQFVYGGDGLSSDRLVRVHTQ